MTNQPVDQRLKSLISNLEAAVKSTSPDSPHLLLLLQVHELAEIVAQMREEGTQTLPVYGSRPLD